jgi:hypothetical protein
MPESTTVLMRELATLVLVHFPWAEGRYRKHALCKFIELLASCPPISFVGGKVNATQLNSAANQNKESPTRDARMAATTQSRKHQAFQVSIQL